MTSEPEKYEVGFSETTGDWHVVHNQLKGNVLHRTILEERYQSEEAASDAAAAMRAAK
ncbi:MAG TPA: hypothetical protein VFW19_07730 [Allosphingosinicella sp.]|nr:hypothetical protein [Allosphingosinicella sp.]